MTYKLWIIALDGSKGAGKSTTSEELVRRFPDATTISLDAVRREMAVEGTLTEKNKLAFEEIRVRIESALQQKKNVLLDCGLDDYRIQAIRDVATKYGAIPHFVFLTAPYEVLLQRVMDRDTLKAKAFDRQRFDEVYAIVTNKDYSQYTVLDTHSLSTAQIADTLEALIGNV